MTHQNPFQSSVRLRRIRKSKNIRDMVTETQLSVKNLIWPVFILEGHNRKEEVKSLPGVFKYSLDLLLKEVKKASELGLPGLALFPVIPENKKDTQASESANPDGLMPQAIREIKKHNPELCLFTDVAMDPYSSDGHDGLVDDGKILNDETLPILAKMALVQAQAGADFIAPSDMMDHRIGYIRQYLDKNGYTNTGLLSYSAKYASAFYGPFRDALDSNPKSGDKKTYQMNPANSTEALEEVTQDLSEGADIVMVKPALSYLDIIQKVSENFDRPVAAYNVSGEYAMLKLLAQQGLAQERDIVLESLTAIKRAGAQIIFTYFAKDVAEWLKDK